MTDIVERLARVIATALGDNYADAFKSKERWTAKRGMSGGRFRDCNEPFQSDYLAAAQAALEWTEAAAEIERLRKHAEAMAKFEALLPSCAGMADAPNDRVVAVYLRIGEIRAVRDFVAAYRAEYPEEK